MNPGRNVCLRCRRPASVCFCSALPSFTPLTKVIFLQHPRERKVAISTCRMAHLAFEGSELHHGVEFAGQPAELAIGNPEDGDVAVLFPSEGAIDPRSLPIGRLKTLVVVDGTWNQAKKLIARNPILSRLPKLGLAPSRPSNYRIRLEPNEQCVSTIEAVVEVLGLLEGDIDRFRPALLAFDKMIDTQIEKRANREGPGRYKRKRTRVPKPPVIPSQLREGFARAVVLYAESNGGTDEEGHLLSPELLQLVAVRPMTGERFSALIAPRRTLAASVPHQVELPGARFLMGETIDGALSRFADFVGDDDLLCGWGRFGYDLWRLESDAPPREFVDLRVVSSKVIKRRAGGMEQAAELLEARAIELWTEGRAGKRIACLESIFRVFAERFGPAIREVGRVVGGGL